MTREVAIKMLRGMKAENLNLNDLYTRDKYEALVIAIKALEQEPVIDKIRVEIESYDNFILCANGQKGIHIDKALEIIDKYKAESEDT